MKYYPGLPTYSPATHMTGCALASDYHVTTSSHTLPVSKVTDKTSLKRSRSHLAALPH